MNHVDLTDHLAPAGVETWHAVAELEQRIGHDTWVVVGGQMVLLHAIANGIDVPRVTSDGDLVIDVRTFGRKAMLDVAAELEAMGFIVERSPENVARYVRGEAKIDLLAPEGMGPSPVLTSPPGRAVQAPGATQAVALVVLLAAVAVNGIRSMYAEMTTKDRQRLTKAVAAWIDADTHPAWAADVNRRDVRITAAFLTAT